MIDLLDDETFLLYAAEKYNNPQCIDTEEFLDDVKRFKYLKRLFGKYVENGDLNERLILNHIVILYNVFGEHATKMLFYRLDGFYSCLKPFLVLLNRLPETAVNATGVKIYTSDIVMNPTIVTALRKI